MKLFIRWIQRVYARCLRLYPVHFREAFGEEMEDIFRQRTLEKLDGGWKVLGRFCLHEFFGLFISLFREHWTKKEVTMKRLVFSGQGSKVSGWGALSFGAAFILSESLSPPGYPGKLEAYFLGGLLGGFLFALMADSRKEIKWLALLGSLAFGGGHAVAAWFLNEIAPHLSTGSIGMLLVAIFLEPALVGTLIGLGIGILEKDWRTGIRLSVACALGFGGGPMVGYLMTVPIWGIAQAINSHGYTFGGHLIPWAMTLVNASVYVVAGMMGGAILGKTIQTVDTE